MSLESDLRDLTRIPLFAALEYEARRLLAFSAETRILRTGDILFSEGDKSDCGYVLLIGQLELEASSNSRRKRLLLPPTLIGEMALLTETVRPGTVVARLPSTILKISQDLFRRVLNEHPKSARQIKSQIASKLQTFTNELKAQKSLDFIEPKA